MNNIYTIASNEPLTASVYRMSLEGDTSRIIRPGQFVNIAIPGRYLRRPISISDYDEHGLTLIYKVVGEGTADLSRMVPGTHLNILTGLGNGFSIAPDSKKPLLVGGGVGVPPLYKLAKELLAEGLPVSVVLGFNTASEIFYEAEFRALGCSVIVTTADGSAGIRGFVTDALSSCDYDYFYACGPLPMLRALSAGAFSEGQVSMEERMGCGFGACMGCSIMTAKGPRRVCKEGPVFDKNDILW